MLFYQYYQYGFIALICIGLLIQNYINMRQYGHKTLSGRYLLVFVLAVAFDCVLEIVYVIRESGLLGKGDALGYIEEILYAVITLVACYLWFVSSELYQRSKIVETRKRRILLAIPFLIMIIITALTPIHHLNFYFENGHYVRGQLTLVFTMIAGVLIELTGISALIRSFQKKFYIERTYFRIIFLYAVILLFFQFLQIKFGSVLPFLTIGATIVIYIIKEKYVKENIYIDGLTGANNRNAAEKYLSGRLEINQNNFHVAVIDIDHFKSINDTFGHNTGDMAIKLLANTFMNNLTGNSFFARLGGDEFLLVNTAESSDEIMQVLSNTQTELDKKCKEEKMKFVLEFSYGIIQKTEEMKNIPDILETADAKMYENKKAKRK